MADDYRYSDDYKEKCFQAWFGAGSPTRAVDALAVIPEFHGRKPTAAVVRKWMNETWMLRSDELSAKAMQLADDNLIIKKSEMLMAQAERGEQLQVEGMKHLKEKGFDSSSAAVQAVIRGAELERTSRGIGELIVKMSKMSEGDLQAEIMKRLQILSDDRVIDVEVTEENAERDDTESNPGEDEEPEI